MLGGNTLFISMGLFHFFFAPAISCIGYDDAVRTIGIVELSKRRNCGQTVVLVVTKSPG